ncbi:MAG: hypothetical protein ACK583_02955 [Cyanobacteriota bacterium]
MVLLLAPIVSDPACFVWGRTSPTPDPLGNRREPNLDSLVCTAPASICGSDG